MAPEDGVIRQPRQCIKYGQPPGGLDVFPLWIAAQPRLVCFNRFIARPNLNGGPGASQRKMGERISVEAAATDVDRTRIASNIDYSDHRPELARFMRVMTPRKEDTTRLSLA
jgi:hypothetical protein